jgi:serine/threonine protein kinase
VNPASEVIDPAADDPRLRRAVQEYLQDLEAGRRPDRRALAGRFPDLAEQMAPYLDALDLVHAVGPMLSGPSGGLSAPAAAEALPVEPLGDFRIVREIGRGGMGIVYEAVQLSLGRRVALKVLPFAAALDARHLQRFKNEAQAAAHLHHPNIVPVYAVGCERGVHFYAMQLIEGQNLATLLEDLRGDETGNRLAGPLREPPAASTGPYPPPAPAVPSPETRSQLGAQLSTQRSDRASDYFRTVARLAAQAAEGLDYAHGLGIIHRDIKPANLLIDGRGNVWVTDFGLALFHTDAGLTQSGDLLGTLRYMSPEQAGGQRVLIDQRTDIYSLGATLYEMLTLRPIFDGTDRQTLLRQILHDEPRSPRAIDRSIAAELETIVLKAVSKSPADRYATARDFADDLQRYLRHEPIHARRATLAQRGRKWLRRHPSVLVTAALLLVLLTAGALVSAGLIGSAYERERQRAAEAEARFQLARRSVDEMIQLSEEELAGKPHLDGLRKRLLESALAYYQEFIELRREDPGAQAELAATRDRVQKIVADLAVLQGAWRLGLLQRPDVLDDLGVSAEQRAALAEMMQHNAPGFQRLSPEEFLAQARSKEAAVADILSPEQRKRLRQIDLQNKGAMAFGDSEVAAALKLTAEQRERTRAIVAEGFFSQLGKPRKSPDEMRRAAMKRFEGLLNEDQQKRWKEMTGRPFTPRFPVFPPGIPPRPGARPGEGPDFPPP